MEEKTYTESAKSDRIKKFLQDTDFYASSIRELGARTRGMLLFNPLENDEINDIFIADSEHFVFCLKRAVFELVQDWFEEGRAKALMPNLHVIITDATKIKLNELNSKYENIPVMFECQIIGLFKEETYVKSGQAYCKECHKTSTLESLGVIPNCPNKDCGSRGKPMEIDRSTLKTGDIRTIMIEEPMEESTSGSPKTLECEIKDEHVAQTSLGDKKKIVGVFRSHPIKNSMRNHPVIHALSIQDLEEKALIMPNEEQEKRFLGLSQKPEWIDYLTQSFAPEIKFEKLAKICLILAIISGPKTDDLRDLIHCLLIGDPSTGKSRLLEFIIKVVRRSAMAVGGTTSGAGVTVTMEMMPNRQKMPRPGVIVKCHKSVAVIDEINQLKPEELGKVYEAQDQGHINYNKGGFDLDLKTETIICAGANPKGYSYDVDFGMMDNIKLPPPLVSRFDLIVNMTRGKSLTIEHQVIEHIEKVRAVGVSKYVESEGLITTEEMSILLNFAKSQTPKMRPDASRLLREFQMKMLELEVNSEQVRGAKPIDRRFFESMYRVATSLAKIHFSKQVTTEHAMLAIEIYKQTMQSFGLKTDKGVVQLNMSDAVTDKNTAAEFTWRRIEKERDAKFIDAIEFLKKLPKEHPGYFKDVDAAEHWFDMKVKKGDIEKREGLYRLR